MDKPGRLQCVTLALSSQMTGGKQSQFFVDKRRKVIKRPLVAICPVGEQVGHFVAVRQGPHVDNAELPSFAPGLYTTLRSVVLLVT